jgi:glycosyltransferase involved in cell wall biosynthesis
MSPSISILLPTRGRPEQAERLLQSIVEMSADPDRIEVVLYVDEDDTASHAIQCGELSINKIIGHRLSMGGLNTACLERSTGDIIVALNDDMVIRTPDWDLRIADVHEKFPDRIYLAYPNDLHTGELLCSTPVLSRITCEVLTHPFPEAYQGGFIDYHLMDIFKRLQVLGKDRIVYLDDVVVEHLHYQYGKSETDATYEQRGPLNVGDEVFVGLRNYRRNSSKRLLAHIQEKPLPELPHLLTATPLPNSDFLAVAGFTGKFLLVTALPLPWRTYCFEVLSRRHFLKKYKYPQPTWQYKLLKMLAPILKWPFQVIQKFK